MSTPPDTELIRKGMLSICTETGTPPAVFYDESSKLSGYLPDLGGAIGARMGLPVSWVDSVFDTIIIAAKSGKCDIILADQFITPARLEQIDMVPYAKIGMQFLASTDKASSLGDPSADPTLLCGLKVGVLLGSVEETSLKQWNDGCGKAGKPAITITTTTDTPGGLQGLQAGLTNLFFTDSPITGYFAKVNPDKFATVGSSIASVSAGISVPKEKAQLKQSVVAVLKAMKQDGSYDAIFKTWGQEAMIVPNPGG